MVVSGGVITSTLLICNTLYCNPLIFWMNKSFEPNPFITFSSLELLPTQAECDFQLAWAHYQSSDVAGYA
jgi:hypothetical protein